MPGTRGNRGEGGRGREGERERERGREGEGEREGGRERGGESGSEGEGERGRERERELPSCVYMWPCRHACVCGLHVLDNLKSRVPFETLVPLKGGVIRNVCRGI